jgi:plasmid maintenance system antidote protein VapI
MRERFKDSKAECGTRARYSLGCRCTPCRRANTEYEKQRAMIRKEQGSDVWVSAEPVKEHLKSLSKIGIGYKTVADYSSVGKTTLARIMNGKNAKIRKSKAVRILAVDKNCVSGGTLISSQRSRLLIKSLMAEDFTKRELARRMGYKSPAIQFAKRRKTTAKVAMRLERFWNIINLEAE